MEPKRTSCILLGWILQKSSDRTGAECLGRNLPALYTAKEQGGQAWKRNSIEDQGSSKISLGYGVCLWILWRVFLWVSVSISIHFALTCDDHRPTFDSSSKAQGPRPLSRQCQCCTTGLTGGGQRRGPPTISLPPFGFNHDPIRYEVRHVNSTSSESWSRPVSATDLWGTDTSDGMKRHPLKRAMGVTCQSNL